MAVGPAIRMWSRTNASLQSQEGLTRNGRIDYAYSVVCDVTDDEDAVMTAPDMPLLGDRWRVNSQMRVKNKVAQQVSPIFWIVQVTYEGEFGPGGAGSDPVLEQPKEEWDHIATTEAIDEDRHGKAIATANGELIHGVTETLYDWVVRIERNYATLDMFNLHRYMRSVSSDSVVTKLGTFPPGTAKLIKFKPKPMFDEVVGGYWKVNAEVAFRFPYNVPATQAWWPRRRHEGFMVRQADGVTIRHAVDDGHDKVSTPVSLKLDGKFEPDATVGHFVTFDIPTPLPYAALGLQ